MKENNKVSNGVIISIVVTSFIVVLIIFSAFVFFIDSEKNKNKIIDDGVVLMTYNSEKPILDLSAVVPISDDDGVILDNPEHIFDFTVDVNLEDSSEIEYEIVILKDVKSTVSDKDVRFYLERQESGSYVKVNEVTAYVPLIKKSDFSAPKGSMVLTKMKCKENSTDNYRLRMWFSDTGEYSLDELQNYKISVSVYGRAS